MSNYNNTKEVHLNSGLYFKRPFESKYSIVRRFYLSNYLIRSGLNSKLSNFKDKHLIKHNIVDYLLRLNFGKQVPKYLMQVESESHLKIRNCPRCSELYYHTPFFQLPWLSTCPVHGDELSIFCVACGNPYHWPFQTSAERPLSCCGTIVDPEKLSLIGTQDHLYSEKFAEINKLFIKYSWHTRHFETLFTPPFERRFGCSIWDKQFAHVIYQNEMHSEHHRLESLGIANPLISIHNFKLVDRPKYKEKNSSDSDSTPSLRKKQIAHSLIKSFSTAKLDTIKTVFEFLFKHFSRDIELKYFDFLAIKNFLAVKKSKPFCPLCVAYSLWIRGITDSPLQSSNIEQIDSIDFLHNCADLAMLKETIMEVEINGRSYTLPDDAILQIYASRLINYFNLILSRTIAFHSDRKHYFNIYDKILSKFSTDLAKNVHFNVSQSDPDMVNVSIDVNSTLDYFEDWKIVHDKQQYIIFRNAISELFPFRTNEESSLTMGLNEEIICKIIKGDSALNELSETEQNNLLLSHIEKFFNSDYDAVSEHKSDEDILGNVKSNKKLNDFEYLIEPTQETLSDNEFPKFSN